MLGTSATRNDTFIFIRSPPPSPPNPNQRYNPGNVKIRSSSGKAISKILLSNGFYSSVNSPTARQNTRRFLKNAKFSRRMCPASKILCFHKPFLYINLNSSFPPNYNPFKWSLPMLSPQKTKCESLLQPTRAKSPVHLTFL